MTDKITILQSTTRVDLSLICHPLSQPSVQNIQAAFFKFFYLFFHFTLDSPDWLSAKRSVGWWRARGSTWTSSSSSSWAPSVRSLACRGSRPPPCARSPTSTPSLSWAKPRLPARSPRSRRWRSSGWLASSWQSSSVRASLIRRFVPLLLMWITMWWNSICTHWSGPSFRGCSRKDISKDEKHDGLNQQSAKAEVAEWKGSFSFP